MTDTSQHEYIFYIFTCNDPNITDCYVGSTRAFRERKRAHKTCCNNENNAAYNLKIYQTIRANGGWNNWEMRPIDTKLCSTLEAHIHETMLMEQRKSTLNCKNAYTSEEQKKEQKKEYYEQHKDAMVEYHKGYREQHKDAIVEYYKEYNKEYREQHKDAIVEYNKEYYEQNKDVFLAKRKEHYEQNKAALLAKRKEYYEQNKATINAKKREAYALKKSQQSL